MDFSKHFPMSLQPWPGDCCSGGNPRSHLSGEIVDIEIIVFLIWENHGKAPVCLKQDITLFPLVLIRMEILCRDVNGRFLDVFLKGNCWFVFFCPEVVVLNILEGSWRHCNNCFMFEVSLKCLVNFLEHEIAFQDKRLKIIPSGEA